MHLTVKFLKPPRTQGNAEVDIHQARFDIARMQLTESTVNALTSLRSDTSHHWPDETKGRAPHKSLGVRQKDSF
ncbi:MAG: hypothetical protein RI575_18150 [Balneolaceae bacterium]|nr:hypothetical protein [Balneolaceae bacterium]MDR9410868.1 hypothetical protein [Balneolaceae bacterium]